MFWQVLVLAVSFFQLAHADVPRAGWRDTYLSVGDEAPNFSLPSTTGETITFSKFRARHTVVLFFYPRAFSPACTREVQGFQEDFNFYDRRGILLLGISVDDPKTNKQFAGKYDLKFPLLSDAGGYVSHQFGAMGWIMAKRVTYVIGPDGLVKQVFPEINVEEHSHEVLLGLGESASTPRASHSRKGKR